MSCREFETTGYLYLSGELEWPERKTFERHLETCETCRQQLADARAIWKSVADLPAEKPTRSVREAVLERARKGRKRSGLGRLFEGLGNFVFFHPRATYGISIATAAVLVFLVVLPMMTSREDSLLEVSMAWQDDFMAEADYLDKELDRLESGVLLANYTQSEDETAEEDDWLSPMSQDLNWIRGKVENLVKTIYGI